MRNQTPTDTPQPKRSEIPIVATIASASPTAPKIRNAVSFGKKKNRLGLLANGTLWTNWETGNNPRSPKSGLN